jgi:hypothetical protein
MAGAIEPAEVCLVGAPCADTKPPVPEVSNAAAPLLTRALTPVIRGTAVPVVDLCVRLPSDAARGELAAWTEQAPGTQGARTRSSLRVRNQPLPYGTPRHRFYPRPRRRRIRRSARRRGAHRRSTEKRLFGRKAHIHHVEYTTCLAALRTECANSTRSCVSVYLEFRSSDHQSGNRGAPAPGRAAGRCKN